MSIETPFQDHVIETILPVLPLTWDRKIARWVSRIASPPILAVLGTLASAATITQQTSGETNAWMWALIMILMCIVAPISYIVYLLKRRKITDFDIYIRSQRFWPYVFSLVCAGMTWLVLAAGNAPRLFVILAGASISQAFIMFLINQRWKISAHAAGAASIAILLWQILGSTGALMLAVIPLVGWSRVRMGRHTLLQVIAGSLLGASVFLTALSLWY